MSGSNLLIDDAAPHGTVSNVADTLDLLSFVTAENMGERASYGLFLIISTCSDALRHVQRRMDSPDMGEAGEINISLTADELSRIESLAARSGLTVEGLCQQILADQLDEVADSVKTPGPQNN